MSLHEKDISFSEFVLGCAQGRWIDKNPDDSLDDLAKQLEDAQQRLSQVEAWDEAEAERQSEESFQKSYGDFIGNLVSRNAVNLRYIEMKRKVEVWRPPTASLEQLKKFILDQLNESIKYDCSWPIQPPEHLSGEEFKTDKIHRIQREIDDLSVHHREEITRRKEQVETYRVLMESLGEKTI